MNPATYFPIISNSRLTQVPGVTDWILVCSYVYGMTAISNFDFLTLKMVRLVPLRLMEPFSITRWLNFLGNSNRNSQLPSRLRRSRQTAVASTCPWTIWPSRRPFMTRHLSRLTRSPGFQSPRLVFLSVSSMAVTRWRLSFISSTVRQTPLWDRLWSMDSCGEMGDSIQYVLLVPWVSMDLMVPSDSMIPVNMGSNFANFLKGRPFLLPTL